MRSCSCARAGLPRSWLSHVQVRQASAFTKSLGERTDSEAGTAQGDRDEDISVTAASEGSSATYGASGESQRQPDSMAAPSVHDDTQSVETWKPSIDLPFFVECRVLSTYKDVC